MTFDEGRRNYMADQQHLNMLNQGVHVWNKWRKAHPEIRPDLRKADLHNAMLNGVNFHRANLEGANFHKARLSTARLGFADISDANLSYANLSYANLNGTHFKGTNLTNTKLSHALLRDTEFINVDLSVAKGLDAVRHDGPSSISLDSIARSKRNIPEPFLRGIGVPEIFLSYLHSQGN